MMQSHFKPIFSLRVFHTYFSTGNCNCLRYMPGSGTADLQQRFGFVMRTHANGFDWYANTATSVGELLSYTQQVTGATWFDFTIPAGPADFYGFTQFPPGWAGQLAFDSSGSLPSDAAGTQELQPQLSDAPNSENLGKLRIHFSSLAAMPSPAAFTISFSARSTIWQYYVVNKSLVALSHPAVTGSGAVKFTGPEQAALPNGQAALLFTSDAAVALSEQPKYKFSLVNQPVAGSSTGAKTIFRALPAPDPGHVSLLGAGAAQQAVSPMYIYL